MAAHYQNTVEDQVTGKPVNGAVIKVYQDGATIAADGRSVTSGTLATIYSDDGVTTIDQTGAPLTTAADGEFDFYTDETRVIVEVLVNGVGKAVWNDVDLVAGSVDSDVTALAVRVTATEAVTEDPLIVDIAALTDPGADRIMFWDDSAGEITWLTAGTGLTITGTTMTASVGIGNEGEWTAYTVATPGDAFIDIPLDTDGGTRFSIMVHGFSSGVGQRYQLQLSDDNGSTFKSGATDYWSQSDTVGAALVELNAKNAHEEKQVEFTIVNMNTASGRPHLIGQYAGSTTGAARAGGTCYGGLSSLAAGDYNAIRILTDTGNLDGTTVLVKRET